MNDLPELLKRHLPEGWSGRQVAREAERRGLKLSPATANNYLNGRGGRPSEDVLTAFSAVLTIPMARLRSAAGLPQGEGDAYTPPVEASRLNRRQRLAVDELIRSIVTAQEVSNASQEQRPQARGKAKQSTPPIVLTPDSSPEEIERWRRQERARALSEFGFDPVTDTAQPASGGSSVSERGDTPTDSKPRATGAEGA